MVGPATIALVHADHVHTSSQALGGNPHSVTGVAGAFETMHHEQRESCASVGLPMAMTKNRHAGFDLNQPFLGSRKVESSLEEETGERLPVTTP